MGWLTPDEQVIARKKFHITALYMCDECNKPISILEMPVVDPRKGYYKWNRKRSPKNCRSFHGKNAKVTYHQGKCDQTPFGIKRYKKHKKYLKKLKQQGDDMAKGKKDKDKKSKKVDKVKKSKKKDVKADPKVKKAVVALITKKENHYDKRRVLKKLSDNFEKAEIRAALASLWADKVTRKKEGKYYLVDKAA